MMKHEIVLLYHTFPNHKLASLDPCSDCCPSILKNSMVYWNKNNGYIISFWYFVKNKIGISNISSILSIKIIENSFFINSVAHILSDSGSNSVETVSKHILTFQKTFQG